jgi:hypothetical protein
MKIKLLRAFTCAALIGTSAVSMMAETNSAPVQELSPEQKAEAELRKIVETCLYDRTNTQPFNYFIDELIKFIQQNKAEVKGRLSDSIQDKELYLNELTEKLESIKYSRNIKHIGTTLYEYVWLLPDSLRAMKPYKIIGYLQARLRHS